MVSNFDAVLKLSSFIFISLIKIFIENEATLYTFEFRLLYDKDLSSYVCFNSAFQLILQNPNFICNVKNLKIYLNSYSDLSLFMKCFYYNCRSISSLYVHSLIDDPVEKGLSNLINSQQNLKIIHIDCIWRFLIREKTHQDSEIILSCIKQYVMKEKRVAYLATDSIPIGSNDVEEFKVHGIQVMRYDQLHIQVYDFINELS
ncbi:hypothetical protein GLOIN_2v1809843 [Rhizophagus irregularis DAOM 181602=DAOM 197198]|nr:hypothetical protein GLOIN_2v1809843 [Rhizophagus irregularis DAOM 181602=DAOM 197198]